MSQQNHKRNYQNDRIHDQQLYQGMNNSDFFSFNRIEEQPFYCPPSETFYPFYSTNCNQNMTLLPSHFFYSQFQPTYPLPQAISTYPLIGNSFYNPLIDSISDYQKQYCTTWPSNDEQSKGEQENCIDLNSKSKMIKYEVKQHPLKIQEKQATLQATLQKVSCKNEQIKKRFQSPSSSNQVGDSMTRQQRVDRYLLKKKRRTFDKRIVYQCRKSVADNRPRVKGRFVKRNPERAEIKPVLKIQNEDE